MTLSYDWQAGLVLVALFMGVTIAIPKLLFKVPAFEAMRLQNREADGKKLSRDAYKAATNVSRKSGMNTNYAFFALVLPFFVSFDSRPLWQHLLEIVAVLAIFDFMYYWMHRSLFHGEWQGNPLRKVHALHHQARKPTYMDALYVHPLETFMGSALFLVSIPIVSLLEGATLNVFSSAIAMLIFTNLNTLNHVFTRLPSESRFYRGVDYITGVHAAHHVDMSHGNYATLTMIYDKLFGTFEAPVNREAA